MFFGDDEIGLIFGYSACFLLFGIVLGSAVVFATLILVLQATGAVSLPHQALNNIKGKSPERVLALGDCSYSPMSTSWLNKISDIKSRTRMDMGMTSMIVTRALVSI